MWVEGGDIHDELLDQLGGVIAPPADLELTPSAAELEALAAAVAARWPGGASAPASESQTAPVRQFPPAARASWRRVGSSAWRAGAVAAGLVAFSASAAAAAGGVPLPRPVRVVAYTVGLPVDSPALDDTNHHIKELKDAVKAQDKPKAEVTAQRLRTDLAKVPSDEKQEAEQKATPVLQQAVNTGLIPPPAPTTTTAPPAVSSTTATTSAAPTTTDTTAGPGEKEKEKEKPAATTTTTAPETSTSTTTTTAPETTTTTAPSSDPGSGGGSPSGDPGTGSGDPSAGGAGGGSGGQGTTTPTTTPDTTTSTTAPASSGGDPPTTTTTTEPPSTTTTTTAPPTGGTASTSSTSSQP